MLLILGIGFALLGYFVWRMVRPMNVFEVTPFFERPVDVKPLPSPLTSLGAEDCGLCHTEFLAEWKTTIHSQAWTDPYFQADWRFDGSQQVCKNCHTPLAWQQEELVLGFNDAAKLDPVLAPNPDFDSSLQHEGVTCAACHYRDGVIVGPYGSELAPHPVRQLENSNEICLRCHVVPETRWDVFTKFPLCGTVAELLSHSDNIPSQMPISSVGASGEIAASSVAELGCVECHMPVVNRPLVEGGPERVTRRHSWRGGHDPEMVKSGLTIVFDEHQAEKQRQFVLSLTNTGAGHYIPTGIPDRHLTVALRLLDAQDEIVSEESYVLKRSFIWRPFIVQLSDTRLIPDQMRQFTLTLEPELSSSVVAAEAVVRYHLLDEKRRELINYQNTDPIDYEVFRQRLSLEPLVQK